VARLWDARSEWPYVTVREGVKYATVEVWFEPYPEAATVELKRKLFFLFYEEVVERSQRWKELLSCKRKGAGELLKNDITEFMLGRRDYIPLYWAVTPFAGTSQMFGVGKTAMYLTGEKELMLEFLPKLLATLEECVAELERRGLKPREKGERG
jgi:hypothetical protein